jgi:hypothetical protein
VDKLPRIAAWRESFCDCEQSGTSLRAGEVLAKEDQHVGVELPVEGQTVEACRVGADFGCRLGKRRSAGCQEREMAGIRNETWYSCCERSPSFTMSTLCGNTPSPPYSEAQS